MKTSYLNSEIYNKLNKAGTSNNKGAQRKHSANVKATIPLLQVAVSLK